MQHYFASSFTSQSPESASQRRQFVFTFKPSRSSRLALVFQSFTFLLKFWTRPIVLFDLSASFTMLFV